LNNQKSTTGMTLVEALIAGMLLVLGLVPVFFFTSQALTLTHNARISFTAGQLAQEGLEVIRTIRDDNWIAGRVFDFGLTECADGCRVQWDSTDILALGSNIPLSLDSTSMIYQYDSGSATPYIRTITIDTTLPSVLKVQSRVDWSDQSGDHSFVTETPLYDWLQ